LELIVYGQCHEIFDSRFFHVSSFFGLKIIFLGSFWTVSQPRENIRTRFTTGVNIGGEFIAGATVIYVDLRKKIYTSVSDTGGKFDAGD
jgi:hypothetical protein